MFAFDGDPTNEYLPHNYTDSHVVAYIGTHDNETIVGSFSDKTDYELAYMYEYLNIENKSQGSKCSYQGAVSQHRRAGDSPDAGYIRAWK